MKIGLFTEFSYPEKTEQQTYAEVLEQIAVADELSKLPELRAAGTLLEALAVSR